MSYSIESLKGLMSEKQGLAFTNVFRVHMPSFAGMPTSEVNLLCKDIQLPGKQITTLEKQLGLKRQKIANGYAVDDISMTFLVLNDFGIKKYFEQWISLAVNEDTQELGFKNEYQREIRIEQLKKGVSLPIYSTDLGLPRLPAELQNRLPRIGPLDLAQGQLDLDFVGKGDVIYEITLENAFPTTINQIQLSNELDGIAELNVQLSYTTWRQTGGSAPSGNLGNILVGSVLNRILN
jgi:hypothetical protein